MVHCVYALITISQLQKRGAAGLHSCLHSPTNQFCASGKNCQCVVGMSGEKTNKCRFTR